MSEPKRTLSLDAETVHELTDEQIENVAGGGIMFPTSTVLRASGSEPGPQPTSTVAETGIFRATLPTG